MSIKVLKGKVFKVGCIGGVSPLFTVSSLM